MIKEIRKEECEDLDRFPNVVLVDSSLDETRRVKLASRKEDFEGRLNSLGVSSLEVLNEEECDESKQADECEDESVSSDED